MLKFAIYFALIKLGLCFMDLLDPVSVSWLLFIHPKNRLRSNPIPTFDMSKCSEVKFFQGCHGTLIHKGVVLVTKRCLLEQGLFGAKPKPFLLTKGMFDNNAVQENFEIGHEQFQILPFKFHDNRWKHLPELVMLRSRSSVQAKPLQIADFVPAAEDLNNECKVYGWETDLQQIGPNATTYGIFSTPVQIINNKHCSGFEHDLCIDNHDETICPQVSSPYLEQNLTNLFLIEI